jgi:peptidoglycan/xylan/chitin deacetylase (PgdA/CDA1 family)
MTSVARNLNPRERSILRHPLERLLVPVEPLGLDDPHDNVDATSDTGKVRCLAGTGPPEWATSENWTLFASISTEAVKSDGKLITRFARTSGGTTSAVWTADGAALVPFSLAEAYHNYTSERWTVSARQRRLSPGLLGAFYSVKRLVPRAAQLAARRALIRWQGVPAFPRWPYDDSIATLLRFAIRCSLLAREREQLSFRWFWPRGARASAILTHDVESASGLRNAVRIADLEEERGLRSSFNIVGRWYDIDWTIVEELHGRGFEIGLHGIYHDRSLFSSRAEFERQLPLVREAALRLGATGFRSPATHRVHDWIAELPVAYDCTVPMSDPYEPQPGGSCSPWPFLLGPVVELPYTLPQDHTVFTLLGHRTIDTWRSQVERLESSYGLIQCLTHPDPGYLGEPANEARYVDFLDFLVQRDSLWHALPREVAQWWAERGQSDGPFDSSELGLARLDDHESVLFVPPERPN